MAVVGEGNGGKCWRARRGQGDRAEGDRAGRDARASIEKLGNQQRGEEQRKNKQIQAERPMHKQLPPSGELALRKGLAPGLGSTCRRRLGSWAVL